MELTQNKNNGRRNYQRNNHTNITHIKLNLNNITGHTSQKGVCPPTLYKTKKQETGADTFYDTVHISSNNYIKFGTKVFKSRRVRVHRNMVENYKKSKNRQDIKKRDTGFAL